MVSREELEKQCKVKASSVKRLHKELDYYEKERHKEEARVSKMKNEGADASDVKQAEQVLRESAMMIPETRQRLEAALAELQSFVSEHEAELTSSEEIAHAKEIIREVEKHGLSQHHECH